MAPARAAARWAPMAEVHRPTSDRPADRPADQTSNQASEQTSEQASGRPAGTSERSALLERAGTYRLAAELFAREPDAELLALASTVPALAAHATPRAAARYTHVFVLNAYPFASVYLDADGGIEGEHAGFTRGVLEALGLRVEPGTAADHIAVQLDALAALVEREADANDAADAGDPAGRAAARARHAQRALLGEHLLPWAPLFLDAVARVDEGLFRAMAGSTRDTLVAHAATLLGGASARPPASGPDPRDEARENTTDSTTDAASGRAPERYPAGIPDDGEAHHSTVDRLSVPARGGLFLCRADLARLGGALGLPLRFGGRRFMLEGLAQAAVQQGASEALTGALADVVRERRRRLEGWAHDLPDLAPLWQPRLERLDATLAALDAPTGAGPELAPQAPSPVGAH